MPMIPQGGPQAASGFGPGPAPLGAGGMADEAGMATDPTDPAAQLSMGGMPQVTPGGVAEAIQAAIEQRQAVFEQAAQEQLMADLEEADSMIQNLMAAVGAEGMTLDGAGGVPTGPLPAPPMAPPGGQDPGMGVAAAALGEAGPMGTGGVGSQDLAAMLPQLMGAA